MRKVVDFITFTLEHAGFNLRAAMEYRWTFLFEVAGMALNDLIFLIYWWLVYDHVGSIGGWERSDTMCLFGFTALSFGLMMTFMGNAYFLPRLIRDGGLDVYLLLPRDPLGHLLVGRMIVAGIGDVVFGVVVLAVMARVEGPSVLALPLLALASVTLLVSMMVISGSLAFYLGDAEAIAKFVLESMMIMGMYPESIYRGPMRVLIYVGIPVAFYSHVPVRMLREPDPWLVAGCVVMAGLFARLAYLVFRRGLVRYESGNLIGTRM